MELEDLLAPRHDYPRGVSKDIHEVPLSIANLRCIDGLTDHHIPTGEEIVGPGATRSALAVVVPVDALGHGVS
jgi:hypothetical protein